MGPAKRPAAAPAAPAKGAPERAAKRARQEDPRLTTIASTIAAADAYPPTVLRMLSSIVKHSLAAAPTGERHAFQEEVAKMIGEVLNSVKESSAAKVAGLQAKVAEGDAEKGARSIAAEAAASLAVEQAQAVEAASAALAAASEEVAAATAAHAEAMTEQQVGDEAYAAAEEKKARLQALLTDPREVTTSATAKFLKALAKAGKDFHFDPHLMVAAVPAFSKPPAERGEFDGVVIGQVEERICSAVAVLDERLQAEIGGKTERAAKVEIASTQLAVANERAAACKAELATAQLSLKEAQVQKKAADKSVKDFGSDMRQVGEALDSASAELQAHEEVLSSFRDLEERASAAPGAEEADAAAAVAPPDPAE